MCCGKLSGILVKSSLCSISCLVLCWKRAIHTYVRMYVCMSVHMCIHTVRTYISSFFQHFLPIHCESEGPLSTYVRMYLHVHVLS